MHVVVYIHGGAYTSGQGIDYSPQYLLDSNDFVYVSINYRLGVLGFAATGDNVLPGNNGMKDQVAALKWVQRNIGAFGGSPKDVTITGMSAGASSVHYHMISPMSKGKCCNHTHTHTHNYSCMHTKRCNTVATAGVIFTAQTTPFTRHIITALLSLSSLHDLITINHPHVHTGTTRTFKYT